MFIRLATGHRCWNWILHELCTKITYTNQTSDPGYPWNRKPLNLSRLHTTEGAREKYSIQNILFSRRGKKKFLEKNILQKCFTKYFWATIFWTNRIIFFLSVERRTTSFVRIWMFNWFWISSKEEDEEMLQGPLGRRPGLVVMEWTRDQ